MSTDTVVQRLPKLMKFDLFSDAERAKAELDIEATAGGTKVRPASGVEWC